MDIVSFNWRVQVNRTWTSIERLNLINHDNFNGSNQLFIAMKNTRFDNVDYSSLLNIFFNETNLKSIVIPIFIKYNIHWTSKTLSRLKVSGAWIPSSLGCFFYSLKNLLGLHDVHFIRFCWVLHHNSDEL